MFKIIKQNRELFPKQFWLLIIGQFIASVGSSMIWPFLLIYVSEQLDLPLTDVAGLISLNGIIGLVSSYFAGPISDRFGRKWLMVVSLVGNGLTYFVFTQATTYAAFAFLMALRGVFMPLYRVGLNAMISDLVGEEFRQEAFSIQRLAANSGVAIGPAIGGFVAVASYSIGFNAAAIALTFYGLSIAFFARETKPKTFGETDDSQSPSRGYKEALSDKPFLVFMLAYALLTISSIILWVLLGVYAKHNYQLPENQYGIIQASNAIMVVVFQLAVTRITKKFPALPVLAVGAAIYSLGVASIALGTGFWDFLLSFVIVTIGELIAMPTAVSHVADIAPIRMRGRYMGLFVLAQGVGRTIAPLLGGMLNDYINPQAIWYGGGLIGLLGGLCFILLFRFGNSQQLKTI